MVNVRGSSGKNVSIQIVGIKETIERLKSLGIKIENRVDKQVVSDGARVARGVQESIMGQHDEKKSVDTGTFAKSITVEKKGKGEVVVKPKNISYPNGIPVSQVAVWLEEGTTVEPPRPHFRGTMKRMQPKIKSNMETVVHKATKEF